MDATFVTPHQDERHLSTLFQRFGIDLTAAAASSFAVSPFITIVDRAIAENASGKRTLAHGVKQLTLSFLQHPLRFCKSREFMWIFGLYSATYATANTFDSMYEWKEKDGSMPKLAATTAVNMTTVIAKDLAFARMFGVVKPHPVPLATIGLFAIRDGMTVVSCFHAPAHISEKLRSYGVNENTTRAIAQIGAPVAVQIFSTPLHLLGLDLYNHPVADRAARFQFVRREHFRSSIARIARVGPAFGLGGIGNSSIRTRLRELME